MTATSPDEKAAQELEGLLKQSLEIARNMFLAQMSNSLARAPNQDPEVSGAMMHYLKRLSEKVAATLKPVRQGNQVIMKAETTAGPAAVAVLTSLLLPAVQAARRRRAGVCRRTT